MKAGFYSIDITPRVGVGLSGYGPYLNRMSIAVRDPLKARVAALRHDNRTAVLISCDLIGVNRQLTAAIRREIAKLTRLNAEQIMVHCSHTHSGPNTASYLGWGNVDEAYNALLPKKIALACQSAIDRLHPVEVAYAPQACEGIGLNREYDRDAPPLDECLRDDWRPAKPELTDTQCHVISFRNAETGHLDGMMSYFGCHPVVGSSPSRYIHGDFVGVAMNMLERENSGCVSLFLQGAQGDVNSCVVHKSEQESLLALDIIAARFTNAVRAGLADAKEIKIDALRYSSSNYPFTSRMLSAEALRGLIAEQDVIIGAADANDSDRKFRMAVLTRQTASELLSRLEAGEDLGTQLAEIQGIRMGPVSFLSSPFEVMQSIKNDVVARAQAPIPLVMGITNDCMGYATDKVVAARGGYAADTVPVICGRMPYQDIHGELVLALLELDQKLR